MIPLRSIDRACELVAAQVKKDHPEWSPGKVWTEVMRASFKQGEYAPTYKDAILASEERQE